MGQIVQGCARTTEAMRRTIQHRQESLNGLARRHGINPKTVAKWRQRTTVQSALMGPRHPRLTVLSKEEEAAYVAFRQHTLLPLDDCLYSLQTAIPHLTRSSLHRCYQRHGIRCLVPPVCWNGSNLKRSGSEVQSLQRYSYGVRPCNGLSRLAK